MNLELCQHCGNQLEATTAFCGSCGLPRNNPSQPPSNQQLQPPPQPTSNQFQPPSHSGHRNNPGGGALPKVIFFILTALTSLVALAIIGNLIFGQSKNTDEVLETIGMECSLSEPDEDFIDDNPHLAGIASRLYDCEFEGDIYERANIDDYQIIIDEHIEALKERYDESTEELAARCDDSPASINGYFANSWIVGPYVLGGDDSYDIDGLTEALEAEGAGYEKAKTPCERLQG